MNQIGLAAAATIIPANDNEDPFVPSPMYEFDLAAILAVLDADRMCFDAWRATTNFRT